MTTFILFWHPEEESSKGNVPQKKKQSAVENWPLGPFPYLLCQTPLDGILLCLLKLLVKIGSV